MTFIALLPVAIAFLFFIGAVVFVIGYIVTDSQSGGSIVVLVLIVVIVTAVIKAAQRGQRSHLSLISKSNLKISEHERALIRKRFQTFQADDYGNPIYDRWHKEINYFIDTVIRRDLTKSETLQLDQHLSEIVDLVESRVAPVATTQQLVFDPSMSPLDFERFCAEQLRDAGWSASVTKASNDQGSDVIAEKDRRRIILQCKLYNRPVGNKAVQEASAACRHEQADFAVVVSNASYTSAARKLALTNNVLLLHFADLSSIDQILDTRNEY